MIRQRIPASRTSGTHLGAVQRLVLAAVMIVALLAPAAALAQQRDPFDPLVKEGSGSTISASTDTTDGEDSATRNNDAAQQPVADESLPTTGGDATSWLALAYMLIAVGAGVLLLGRVLAPRPARSQ